MNTADFLLERGHPEHPALLTADGAITTYAGLRALSERVVAELTQVGIRPGDRVGLLGANSPYWAAAYLGVLNLGAVAVPFANTATPEQLARMQALAACRAVYVDSRRTRQLPLSFGPGTRVLTEADVRTAGDRVWLSDAHDPSADAALMFTSGSTAEPKAVRITGRNLQANTDSIIASLGLAQTDRILAVLPFDYCFGASLLHTHLRVGGSLVMASLLYPETALDVLDLHACTGLAGVPTVYQTLLRRSSFGRRAKPSLRKIQQAGGKLAEPLIRELLAAAPGAEVFVMYGQTEATARLSCLAVRQHPERLGSIGRGIPGVTLEVLDADGRPVKPGEVGEVWADGANISPGYLDAPAANAAKFPAGRLRTGDLATVDDDGYLYIKSRESDFIKSAGYRVAAAVIESCVLELPAVTGVAAIGIADAKLGEAIRVVVTLRPGAALAARDLIAHVAQRLSRHMVPRDVVVVDRLPLTANGKIDKQELRRCAA
jgi:acyl-CoA synthetase (AMP-forming)/AMP-acid ligase II